jgi:hypothetical protein
VYLIWSKKSASICKTINLRKRVEMLLEIPFALTFYCFECKLVVS